MSNLAHLQAGSVIKISPDMEVPSDAVAAIVKTADGGTRVELREAKAPIAEIHFGPDTDYARAAAQLAELAPQLGGAQSLGVAHHALTEHVANQNQATTPDAADISAALLQAAAANENKAELAAEAPAISHTAHDGKWLNKVTAGRESAAAKDTGGPTV